MASVQEGTGIEIPQYRVLLAELEKITTDKKIIAQKMAVGMRYAAKPSYDALLSNVRRLGKKTGNLLRAVTIKVKSYSKTGNAVALVGYTRPGSDSKSSQKTKSKGRDKAYHAHLVEFGTKPRRTKTSSIASSYGRAAFGMATFGGSVKTQGFPSSFFKRAPQGQTVNLGAMPAGGRSGTPPVKDAFDKTKGQINQRLIDRTQKVIDSVYKALAKAKSK